MENLWRAIVPLFEIPEPPRYRLSDAPLVQALAQVRYPLLAEFESLAGIARLQALLRDTFPYMEQEKVAELSLVVGPAGPAAASGIAEQTTWKFTNDDGPLVVVGAGTATLSMGPEYTNVADFAANFRRVLESLSDAGVARCDRLGARYLSVAPDLPGDERAWRRWFNADLLGWVGSDAITSGALFTSINQVQVSHDPTGEWSQFPAKVEAVVRHGALPIDALVPGIPPVKIDVPSYMLDLDLFCAGPQPLAPNEIVEMFSSLHSEIDKFFYWSLSEGGRQHFGLEIIAN